MTVAQLIEKLQGFNPKLEVQFQVHNPPKSYRMPIQTVKKLKDKKVSKHADHKTIITIS